MGCIELGTPDLTQENAQKPGELFLQVQTEVRYHNVATCGDLLTIMGGME